MSNYEIEQQQQEEDFDGNNVCKHSYAFVEPLYSLKDEHEPELKLLYLMLISIGQTK